MKEESSCIKNGAEGEQCETEAGANHEKGHCGPKEENESGWGNVRMAHAEESVRQEAIRNSAGHFGGGILL